jgi:hypothetical protein
VGHTNPSEEEIDFEYVNIFLVHTAAKKRSTRITYVCEYPTYINKSLTLYIQETFNGVMFPVKTTKTFTIPRKGKRKQFFPPKLRLCK